MDMISILFIGGLGPLEISLLVAVVLLLFGGKKIPELMKGLGKGMTEFKKARSEAEAELDNTVEEPADLLGKDKSEKIDK